MDDFKNSLYKIVGERIKLKREKLEITQKHLSENLGISRASVSNIEVGRHQATLVNLYEISQLLKIDICDLLPKYDEVILSVNSKVLDYTSHVDKEKFNDTQIDSIKELLKKLQ